MIFLAIMIWMWICGFFMAIALIGTCVEKGIIVMTNRKKWWFWTLVAFFWFISFPAAAFGGVLHGGSD